MSSISVQRQCRFSESCGRGNVPGCRSVGRWRLLGPCSVPGCRNGARWNLFARGSVLDCRSVGRWRLRVPCSGHGCRNDARSRLFVRYNVRICRTCDRLHPCDPDRRPVRCRTVRVAKIRRRLHGRRAGRREGVKGFSACFLPCRVSVLSASRFSAGRRCFVSGRISGTSGWFFRWIAMFQFTVLPAGYAAVRQGS